MKTEATCLIRELEQALKDDDPDSGRHLQDKISKVWKDLPPDSEERMKLATLWKQMMIKWR